MMLIENKLLLAHPSWLIRLRSYALNVRRTTQDARRKTHDAFTLLELLLAMGISTLVLVSAYSGLRIGWVTYQRLDGQIQGYQSLRSGFLGLAKDLGNSFLFDAGDDSRVAFSGTQGEMSFTTLVRSKNKEGLNYAEVAKVFYKFEEKNLLRAYIKGKALLNPGLKPEYEVFLTDLTGLAFIYAARTAGVSSLSWKDSWTDKTMLPAAVRLKLTQAQKGFPPVTLLKSIRLTSIFENEL